MQIETNTVDIVMISHNIYFLNRHIRFTNRILRKNNKDYTQYNIRIMWFSFDFMFRFIPEYYTEK